MLHALLRWRPLNATHERPYGLAQRWRIPFLLCTLATWAAEVLELVKRLPREDRERILQEVQAGLEKDHGPSVSEEPEAEAEVDAAWRDEAVRRARQYLAGEVAMVDGEALYLRLRAKYDR